MVRSDKIVGTFLFLLFAGAFIMARGFPPKAATYVLLINILGMVLSACLIISAFLRGRKGKDKPLPKLTKEIWIKILVMSIGTLVYAVMIKIAGYVLSTILYSFSMFIYLYAQKRTKKYLLIAATIAVAITLLLFFVFAKWLYIPLPEGILF